MSKGTFIVIEGSDGSGKSTQFKLLKDYFEKQGKKVKTYKFPRYEKPSAHFVTSYLNGLYGDANSLGAHTPSLFYALDRFEAGADIRKDLDDGNIVLCDRYVGSNMAHQGQKIDDNAERRKYFDWVHNLEFTLLDIPKPDANIVLLMPAEIASRLMEQREKREYTNLQKDIHEVDINHLKRAVATYQEMCALFPDTFTPVHGTNCGALKQIEDIHKEIAQIVIPILT